MLFPSSKKAKVQYSIADEGNINDHSLGFWNNVEMYPAQAKKFGCPAVASADNRLFYINSPMTIEIEFGYDTLQKPFFTYVYDESQHPVNDVFHDLLAGIFHIEHNDGIVNFQILLPYVFITDDDLTVTTIGPNVKMENCMYVPGALNIKNWIRNLNSAWTVIDPTKTAKVTLDVNKPIIQFLFDKPIDLHYDTLSQKQKDYHRNIQGIVKSKRKVQRVYNYIKLRRPEKLL